MDDIITTLRLRQEELKLKFLETPRIFDEAEWRQLYEQYVEADLGENANSVRNRINNYKYILRNEHTPMTAAVEHAEPWQLRADIR